MSNIETTNSQIIALYCYKQPHYLSVNFLILKTPTLWLQKSKLNYSNYSFWSVLRNYGVLIRCGIYYFNVVFCLLYFY